MEGFGDFALGTPFDPPTELKRFAQELAERFGAPESDKPRIGRMEAVLENVLSTTVPVPMGDLRHACYGLAHQIGPRRQQIIASREAFARILAALNEISNEPGRHRRCYLGLLHTYFELDGREAPEPIRKHWLSIREYLQGHLRAVLSADPVPEWAQHLSQHVNLFWDSPCNRYAKDILDGEYAEFDDLRARLGISGTSWLVQEAAISAIRQACEGNDSAFVRHIPQLQKIIQGYPGIQGLALAEVLKRYVRMKDRPENPALLNLSVSLWNNPLFRRNLPNWDLAGPDATSMVASWLKSTLIEDFFELLSSDGTADRRRVRFWQRYTHCIDDMYFALGRRDARRMDADISRLRRMMGDNFLRLEGGTGSNNGFFMVMGERVVVEFGEPGNAVYVFRRDTLPFRLAGTVDGTGRQDWRDLDGAHHLRHADNVHGYGRWEEYFANYLDRKFGIRP